MGRHDEVGGEFPTANAADGGEENLAAVEDGDGEQIEDGEVDVDQNDEPEGAADIPLRLLVEGAGDADGAAEFRRSDIGAGTEERAQRAERSDDVVGDLGPRGRVENDDVIAVAKADARNGFPGAFVGIEPRLDAERELCGAALEQEFAGPGGVLRQMFADGDALENGFAVDGDDAVARLDPGEGGRPIGQERFGGEVFRGFDAGDADLIVAEEAWVDDDLQSFTGALDDEDGLAAVVTGATFA